MHKYLSNYFCVIIIITQIVKICNISVRIFVELYKNIAAKQHKM